MHSHLISSIFLRAALDYVGLFFDVKTRVRQLWFGESMHNRDFLGSLAADTITVGCG